MTTSTPLIGRCACGQVTFELSGPPISQDYCHCRGCRVYHCAPFICGLVCKESDFKITKGEDVLFKVNNTPELDRYSCPSCRSPIYNKPAFLKGVAVTFPSLIKEFTFEPDCHIWFSHAVVPEASIADGLKRYPEWPPFGDMVSS